MEPNTPQQSSLDSTPVLTTSPQPETIQTTVVATNRSPLVIVLTVLCVFLLATVGVLSYYIYQQPRTVGVDPGIALPPEEGVACTMDAMLCPDGSSVGRVPPSCEFAPCPTSTTADSDTSTSTYTNTTYKYQFEYPPTWKWFDSETESPATATSKKITAMDLTKSQGAKEFKDYFDMWVRISPYGMLNTSGLTAMSINGLPGYMQGTMHGNIYYVNIPDTDTYLQIEGVGGGYDEATGTTTPNPHGGEVVLETFKFIY